MCCYGNSACIHPSLAPSCHGPVVSASQPMSATRLLPRVFKGLLPSLRALHKTLLKMRREGGGRRWAPPGYSICLWQSFAAAAGARASVQARFIKPGSEWGRAEAATERRAAEILPVAGGERWQKLGGDSDIPVSTSSQP